MNKYGESAIKAARLYQNKDASSLRSAWEQATTEMFGPRSSGQRKSCPRDAFLGLCEKGLVKGIPLGDYTRSDKNKGYAILAVEILRESPELADDPGFLWKRVIGGEYKAHNSQMDVVTALWKAHLIKI